mgnify:CR=1 FL=1
MLSYARKVIPLAEQSRAADVHNVATGRRNTRALWMYDSEGNPDKGQLVELYAPLVKRIAFHLMAKLPSSVNVDDLMQNGMIGLLDAVDRYEEGAAQFETYASQRIRGAMLDGLREDDWMPRGLRRDMRRVDAAVQTLEQRFGRAPNETELAGEIGVPLPEYQQILQDARGHQLVYFEDFKSGEDEDFFEHHVVDQDADPLGLLEDADFRRALVSAIGQLPEREQLVMSLYYDEELNLREIGEVLGVTESRVCQLHSQAVARLRANVFGEGSPAPAKRRGRPPRAKG